MRFVPGFHASGFQPDKLAPFTFSGNRFEAIPHYADSPYNSRTLVDRSRYIYQHEITNTPTINGGMLLCITAAEV